MRESLAVPAEWAPSCGCWITSSGTRRSGCAVEPRSRGIGLRRSRPSEQALNAANQAAIDPHDAARHVRGTRACEKHRHRSELLGLPVTARGYRGTRLRLHLLEAEV